MIAFGDDFADLFVLMTLTRASAGAVNSEGQYVAGASSSQTIKAVPPQPVKMGELVDDDSGQITRSHVRTYTATPLQDGDLIAHKGITYRVDMVTDRDDLGSYYRAYMVRVQNDH